MILDLLVALFALGFMYGVGFLTGYLRGRESGYRQARTIPIGTFKALSIGLNGTGIEGIIHLDNDVELVPGPTEDQTS